MQNGKCVTVQAGYHLIVIEGDNQMLMKALEGGVQVLWEIQTVVEDIKIYHGSCIRVHIQHIFKEEIKEYIRWQSLAF